MQQEKIEVIKLFCYIVFLFLFRLMNYVSMKKS